MAWTRPARGALELLAVCERFGLEDLERAFGPAVLEALESGGLVSVVSSGRRTAVRLAHPLHGEVLRAGLPRLRLRRIHQQLADIVEAHGARRREDVVQVALWRVDSGGRVPGDQLVSAARLALVGHDPGLAIRLIRGIADDDESISPGERAEVLAEAYAMQGDDVEVERVVASAWEERLSDGQRAHLSQRLATTRFSVRRDLDGALAATTRHAARLSDPEEVAAVDARRATLLAGAGRPSAALRIADAVGSPRTTRTRVELAAARAASLISLGRCDEAAAMSRQAASDHEGLPGWLARRGIASHLLNEAHALAYSGRYALARELLEPAAERARSVQAAGAWVWFEMALAEVARDTGRAEEAIRRFQAVAEAAPSAGQDAVLVWAHVGVAQGHLLLGACGPAAAALERADSVGDSPVATSVATRERTRAWLDACHGDLVSARRRIREVVAQTRRDEVFIFEAGLLNDLVRLGVPAEAVERLQQLAQQIDGPLVQAHASHARAAVERDADLLDDVVGRYETIDALGLAAETASELAELYRARGETRRADCRVAPIGGAGGPGRGDPHPGAGARHERRAADSTGTRGRPAGGRRLQQPPDRRAPPPLDPHRRHAPRARLPEAGHLQPLGARRGLRVVIHVGRASRCPRPIA